MGTAKPTSREVAAAADGYPTEEELAMSKLSGVKGLMLRLGGYWTAESTRMRAAKRLYAEVKAHSTSPAFLEPAGLPVSFRGRYGATVLHVWLLLVRLRAEGDEGSELAQVFYDNFMEDLELLVREEGVVVRVSKWMKELESFFYGSAMAYDKGLKGGPGELRAALVRCAYEPGMEDKAGAEALERYVRRELTALALTDAQAVLDGRVAFVHDCTS